ncbi:MAG: guanine deaminase [Spirochaetia bacterium]|nr:guanine deaminase [Spirochaetia bacterium]
MVSRKIAPGKARRSIAAAQCNVANVKNLTTTVRGAMLDMARPVSARSEIASNLRFIEDGLLVAQDGLIVYSGPWDSSKVPGAPESVMHFPGKLIVPGFIDTHVHYPQAEMIGAYGEQLLDWLNQYAFPTEQRYADIEYARKMADFFVRELLRNGTTTALVFCTVHPESVDALFETAQRIDMRVIAGKVLMDQNAPDYLLDTAISGYESSKALIEKWHKKGRLLYAITPRFAPTSTDQQLAMAGKLKGEYPDVYVHTHLSENRAEIDWVKDLFPGHDGYLDVYHHHGLTGSRSVFAHCVHLRDHEWKCLSDTESAIAFCPTSNLFLGSGLFPLKKSWERGVRVGMGTDVGAGTSFSMLQTLNEAYKVAQLQNDKLSAFEAFYLATLGGAKSLSLDHLLGNFDVGKEADFIVLDPGATPLLQKRNETCLDLEQRLFALFTLGDDRCIHSTFVNGTLAFEREGKI